MMCLLKGVEHSAIYMHTGKARTNAVPPEGGSALSNIYAHWQEQMSRLLRGLEIQRGPSVLYGTVLVFIITAIPLLFNPSV